MPRIKQKISKAWNRQRVKKARPGEVWAHQENILAKHLGQGQQHRADSYREKGDLLQEDPVPVPLDHREVSQEAWDQSAQARADSNAHNQLGGLLSIPQFIIVQGNLLGKHWQVNVGDEISKESERNCQSPDYESLVPPVRKIDKAAYYSLQLGFFLLRARAGFVLFDDWDEGEGAEHQDWTQACHQLKTCR